MTGTIAVRTEERASGRVARLVFDNQAKLNTLTPALMEDCLARMRALAEDPALRALVLEGAGDRAFVGGADINTMAALDPAGARRFITTLHECCDAVRRFPVPVVARMQGYTLGAGLELAAACDLRIAAEDARFGMPEVRIGVPSVIEAVLLPGLIGWGRTRRLLLTGETIGAAQGEAWGLVEEVVPVASLDAAVDRALDMLLAGGPQAMRTQKRLIAGWEEAGPAESVRASIEAFADSFRGGEPQRMMGEFLDAQRRRKQG